MTRSVTALFESVEAAERAAHDLATRVGGVRGTVFRAGDADGMSGLGLPAEDVATLGEHTRRGGAVFHADVPEEKFDAVCQTLESAGAQDFEERESSWKNEGWTPSTGVMPSAGAADQRMGAAGAASAQRMGAASTAAKPAMGAGVATGGEERIPIVEEQLRVGKRETAHGRVRVRSYVVETPVQEQVRLHEERVQVERRPVDRPLGAADEAAFRERTIEATETREEAVVSKEARVKEEVVLRKQADDRTETVSDTVRRTEVKVEDDRKPAPDRGRR